MSTHFKERDSGIDPILKSDYSQHNFIELISIAFQQTRNVDMILVTVY